MTEVGTAYVTLVPSAKGFAAKMQREIGGDLAKAGTTGGGDYSRGFTDSAGRGINANSGRLFKGLAKAGGLAAIAAGAVVGKVLADSIGAASDLGETVSKINQIFGGKDGAQIVDWSQDAATALGQSSQQALDAAATFATFGKSAGLSGENLRDFSTDFTGLATDLASFHNAAPEETIEAIGAALRGEAEPMRRFGVLLDDATLREEALRLGIVKTTKDALTPQQKVLAAQASIYKQTSDAQGDFERTSDGLANQQRILTAEWENAKAKLGTGLLPVMTDLAGVASDAMTAFVDFIPEIQDFAGALWDELAPAVEEIKEAFGNLAGEGGGLGDMLKNDLLPAVGTFADVIGGIVDFIDDLPGPVKDMGVQAGIAAIAFSALSGGVARASGAMAGLIGSSATAATRLAALGTAARGAAGIGGLVLLTKSVEKADYSTSALKGTLAGALVGFSVGGPWGAAVGAVGGLAVGIKQAGNASEVTFDKFSALAGSLDEMTGAMDGFTRKAVAESIRAQGDSLGSDFVAVARESGISLRQLTDAALGGESAMKRIMAQFKASGALVKTRSGWFAQEQAVEDLIDTLNLLEMDYKITRRETRLNAKASQDWAGKLKEFPKNARTKILLDGVMPTLKGIAKVTNQYKNIDNKDLRAILEVTGVEASVKDVRSAAKVLEDADEQEAKPDLNVQGVTKARTDVESVRRVIQDLDGNRADTYIYTHHIDTYESRGSGGGPGGPGLPQPSRIIGPSGPVPLGGGGGWEQITPRAANRMALVLSDGTALDAYLDERIDARLDLSAEAARALGGSR